MKKIFVTASFLLIFAGLRAQSDEVISRLILEKDSLFWKAYNSCDFPAMQSYFSPDVEFYHDKGGPSFGAAKLVKDFGEGPCKPGATSRLRREAVPNSVRVYPMRQADTVYGAIISGSHYFYIVKNGGEKRDGLAQFTHLWLKQKGTWTMKRILSFDHGPAPFVSERKMVEIPAEQLQQLAGSYKGPMTNLKITANKEWLMLHTAKSVVPIFPESADQFFMKEMDITFTFTRNEKGQPVQLTVRENGQIAETLHFLP